MLASTNCRLNFFSYFFPTPFSFPLFPQHEYATETAAPADVEMETEHHAMHMDADDDVISRRTAFTSAAAGLAATIAANVVLPLGPARAAETSPLKVVAVPYTPYQVKAESSAEAIEVAKALKASGARLYGAFWCENCNKQKELLGKEAMEYVNYVECFPNGVYQNSPGHDDVTTPDKICEGYTSAWPLWVVPKDGTTAADGGLDEIGIQGQIKKPKELMRLVKEAKGDKFDALAYFTSGGDGYGADEKRQ